MESSEIRALLSEAELSQQSVPVLAAVRDNTMLRSCYVSEKTRMADLVEKRSGYDDRFQCRVCGKIFPRSARVQHKKTIFHTTYERVNETFRSLLLTSPYSHTPDPNKP